MRKIFAIVLCVVAMFGAKAKCADYIDQFVRLQTPSQEVFTGVLSKKSDSARFAYVLLPGGDGIVNARFQDGQLRYGKKQNFLLRARAHLIDSETVSFATDATSDIGRIRAIKDWLKNQFPRVRVIVISTSRGSFDSVELTRAMGEEIDAFVHTSALTVASARANAKRCKAPQLFVHHVKDACANTTFEAAKRAAEREKIDFIAIDGGITRGNPCQPFAYHGYNGKEAEVVERIKLWVKTHVH